MVKKHNFVTTHNQDIAVKKCIMQTYRNKPHIASPKEEEGYSEEEWEKLEFRFREVSFRAFIETQPALLNSQGSPKGKYILQRTQVAWGCLAHNLRPTRCIMLKLFSSLFLSLSLRAARSPWDGDYRIFVVIWVI